MQLMAAVHSWRKVKIRNHDAYTLLQSPESCNLEGADDAGHDAQDAGIRAARAALWPWGFWEEAPVTGTCICSRDLSRVAPVMGRGHPGYVSS
jgi:hypothetical protein